MNEDLKKQLEDVKADLQHKIDHLERIIERHRHTGDDGSDRLQYTIDLAANQKLSVGNVARFSGSTGGTNSKNNRVTNASMSSGDDSNAADGLRDSAVELQHQYFTDGTTNVSYFVGSRGPIFSGNSVIKNGENSILISDFNLVPDSLVNMFLSVQSSDDPTDPSKSITALIIANTAHTVTVASNWTFSGNVFYITFIGVVLGALLSPWRGLYVSSADDAGINIVSQHTSSLFGTLNMDISGDLYWFNPVTEVNTKLN